MTRLIADTHALLWHLTAPGKLGRGARHALMGAEAGRALALVPAIVLAEIGLLHERGRTKVTARDVVQTLQEHPGFAVLALDAEQAIEFGALRGVKDPIDRLILAAARVTQAKLLSVDEGHDGFGVVRIWD